MFCKLHSETTSSEQAYGLEQLLASWPTLLVTKNRLFIILLFFFFLICDSSHTRIFQIRRNLKTTNVQLMFVLSLISNKVHTCCFCRDRNFFISTTFVVQHLLFRYCCATKFRLLETKLKFRLTQKKSISRVLIFAKVQIHPQITRKKRIPDFRQNIDV